MNNAVCNKKNVAEPLFRITKRVEDGWRHKLLVYTLAVLIALILDSVFIVTVAKINPFTAFGIILQGTFGSDLRLIATLKETILLLGISVALAPAYKMKFWNIGAQGQLLVGAIAASIVMIKLGGVINNVLLISLMLLVSVVAGGIWGAIPAIFKANWNTNETLFTLMMNYVAINIVNYFTENWRGQKSSLGMIGDFGEGWLPVIADKNIILPAIIIMALTVGMFFYLKKSKHGYEISVVGESLNTAKYAGINVKKVILRTMAISGAVCGLIGFIYVSGINHSIASTTSGSYGFTAIIVCWLSGMNPLVMIGYSFIISFLSKGSSNLANSGIASSLNSYSAEIITGIILFCILATDFFINYKVVVRKSNKKTANNHKEAK